MISHLKKTVFHLGSGWIWKRSARKNLVASQAHKGWRDRIRTRLNYAIAHELARWWLVEPKNMASNMVILYNATYIYIVLVLFPVSNDSDYILISNLQQGAHPQRMMNPNDGWCSWMGSKHTRFEWSVQKILASKQWSYVILVILNGGFSHFHFPFVRGKLIQTGPNSCSLRSVCHHPSSPVPTARPARPQRWSNAALGATKQKGCAIGQKSTCGVSQVLSSVCSG